MVKGTLSFDESRIGFDILKFHKTFYAMLGLLRILGPILQNVFIAFHWHRKKKDEEFSRSSKLC